MKLKENNIIENPTDLTLKITRIFDAPRSLVFEVWTKKEHIIQWLAPKNFTVSFSEGDLRPGGAWRSCMISPDGEELWLGGVYREIVENELLIFTHAWEEKGKPEHETLVTVKFFEEDNKTKLVFEQGIFKSKESRDGHEGGWTECLEKLSSYLVKLRSNS